MPKRARDEGPEPLSGRPEVSTTPRIPRPCELVRVGQGQSRVVPEGWKCGWCARDRTSKRRRGPHGPYTLCNTCGQRHAEGRGPPVAARGWKCGWCARTDVTQKRCRGPDGPATLCDSCGSHFAFGGAGPPLPTAGWRCAWCACAYEDMAARTTRRAGPDGPQTLCDRCGQRYKRGALPLTPDTPRDSLGREQVRYAPRPAGRPWRCGWCAGTREEARSRRRGPDGPCTLCRSCGERHARGEGPASLAGFVF